MWAQQPTVRLPAPSPATRQSWAVHPLWGFCYLQVAYPLPVLDHHYTPGSLGCKAELCPVTVGEPQDDERPPPVHGKLSAPCVALTSGATGPVELKLPRLLSPGASLPLAVAPTEPQPWPQHWCLVPTSVSEAPGGPGARGTGRGLSRSWSMLYMVWTPTARPSQRAGSRPTSAPCPTLLAGPWLPLCFLSSRTSVLYRGTPRPAATALGTRDTDWAPLLAAESETLWSVPQPVSQQAVSVFCRRWDRLWHAW